VGWAYVLYRVPVRLPLRSEGYAENLPILHQGLPNAPLIAASHRASQPQSKHRLPEEGVTS
jgi:hypothetical protein